MCVSAVGEYRVTAHVSLRVDLSVGTLRGSILGVDCVCVTLLGDPVGVGGLRSVRVGDLCCQSVCENVGALGGGWRDGLCV